jgi:hypothetical protein
VFTGRDMGDSNIGDQTSAPRINKPCSPALVSRLAEQVPAAKIAVVAIFTGRLGLRVRTPQPLWVATTP